jgi:glycerol-3-phosphate dehydrogenase
MSATESWRASRSFDKISREAELRFIGNSNETWDLVIVGGGITGAAIARDAASRKLRTLLIEKSDFASGTSSRSSKLVHGGVRYLEQLEFKLVMESTRERGILWKHAAHLVQPLKFIFPTFRSSRVPLWKLSLGLWLYDILALFRSPGRHRTLSAAQTQLQEPTLTQHEVTGSVVYWDGSTDDARLTLANIIDARSMGALCLARVSFDQSAFDPSTQLHTLRISDELSAQSYDLKARAIVIAGGPWTDSLLPKVSGLQAAPHPLLKPTRGSHIVVKRDRLPVQHAVVLFHPDDGRVLFAIPWGPSTVVGTTDLVDPSRPENVVIQSDEIEYLIQAARYYFPKHPLRFEDVVSTWSGLRPLVAPPTDQVGASEISRDHYIKCLEPRVFIVTGGKLTTHREMAEQALNLYFDQASSWLESPQGGERRCITGLRALPRLHQVHVQSTIAEFECLFQTQCILSIEDLLVRRSDFFYHESDNGLAQLPRLKPLFLKYCGWSDKDYNASLISYIEYVNKNVRIPLKRPLLEPGRQET